MRSQIHIERDDSLLATVRRMLAPTGGALSDGMRLAVLNGAFLIAALAAAFVLAVLANILDWFLPVPDVSPGLVVLVLSVIFALVVWYRYARQHSRLAQASGRDVQPDRYGVIAGAPFAVLAVLLALSGIFGLVISVVGLSFAGMGEALGRLVFAVLFGLLAAGSVVVARLAMRSKSQ